MNRQLLGWLLTQDDLFLDYVSKIDGLGLKENDWGIVNWAKLYRKEAGRLPKWEELQTRYAVIPNKEALDKKFVEGEIGKYIREERMKTWLIKVAGNLDKGTINYSTVFDDIRRLKDELDFTLAEGAEIRHKYKEVMDVIAAPEMNKRVPSGIVGLDTILGGGFGRGEIAIMIAPPGVGKTTFLINTMYASIANRKNCLLISFELSEHRILERLYKRIAKVSRTMIRSDKDSVIKILDRFFRFTKTSGLVLYKRPYNWSVEDIGLYIDKLRAKGIEIDVLCIDYLDKIKSFGKDFRIALRDVTEDLRYLSIEKNVVLVTATQANRAALTAVTITEEHVSEAFGKVEVADVVMSLGRTQKDEEKGQGRIVLLKNREAGGKGTIVPVNLDLEKCVMESMD